MTTRIDTPLSAQPSAYSEMIQCESMARYIKLISWRFNQIEVNNSVNVEVLI
jgi:hypothetical protein